MTRHDLFSIKKGVLTKLAKFTQCFPMNFAKAARTPFLKNTFGGYFCHFSTKMIAKIPNRIINSLIIS